ncbi:response regulator [Novosphingobium nitrogenifigens]|uniref:response regulator n=1 Tax=Novosphingobium nitrogenifigens TaxID=378548 RepID=UPI00146154BA|nr:response regulator transcription factor [Novosphingobium nitrogenifigens]
MPRSACRQRQETPLLRLMIADDHPIFRSGLKWALEQFPEVGEVRVASSFEELTAILPEWAPDIVILDLNMPTLTAPESLRYLRQRHGGLPVLILSASGEPDDVIGTLRAGASGYITKASEVSELLAAVKVILDGGVFLPDGIIAARCDPIGPARPAEPSPSVPRLTRRQYEVLTLTLQGHANKVIAHNLSMSEGTVKTHLSAVMRLYGVNNRVQLLREVERVGYRS